MPCPSDQNAGRKSRASCQAALHGCLPADKPPKMIRRKAHHPSASNKSETNPLLYAYFPA